MPDPNSPPTLPTPTSPPEAPKKPTGERREINQGWLDAISGTEKLAVDAANTDYAAKLAKRKIDTPWLAKLNADLERARALTGHATGKTTGKKLVMKEEQVRRAALIAQIQSVQSAAKQRFFAKNKPALADYYYGKNVQGMSRADFEACAKNILDKAKVADLPGIGAEELQAFDDALEAYKDVETDQSSEQSAATTARKTLEKLVKEIADQRREL